MQPKMSDEKTTPAPTIVFTQNEVSPPKPRPYRKYVIIAVTGVVATAIVLTAILVGMHLFTEAQKDILKFSYSQDKDTTEDVISNPNTNIVRYHVNGPKYEMWVVNDFNRDIQVMKVQVDTGTTCYVTALNRTAALDPSQVSALTDGRTMDRNKTSTLTYRAADTPIEDTSFLSKTARDECQGVSTYWMHPTCNVPNEFDARQNGDHRTDRSTGCCCRCCRCCLCCPCCTTKDCTTIA